jgi:hypothetical protein
MEAYYMFKYFSVEITSVMIRHADPFQTQYFSENLVSPGIEPGPLDL